MQRRPRTWYLTSFCAHSNMRVWPGTPYPLGATWDGVGVNFAIFSEHATARRAVPVRLARRRGRVASRSRCPSRPTWSGTATCPTCGRASSTAIASTARTTPHTGHRFNPHKLVLDPYAKVIGRTVRWDDALFGFTLGHATTRRSTSATARRSRRSPRSSTPRSPGATTGRRARRGTRRSSTSCTSRASRSCNPHVPEALRGTYLGAGLRAGDPPPDVARRHGRRADAGAPPRRRPAPRRSAACANYWGYNTLSFFAPDLRYASSALAARRGARVQDDGARAARRRPRGDPRRRLQPHGRREPPRADAVAARHRQRVVLPAAAERPALLPGLHRLRQHAEHAQPARAAADHGQPALLGAGDARRRVPLRPRERAGPRAARGRPARRVLRHHPPGSRALAGEADRRAVGPRRRRLPGRQLPGPVDGVERQVPRRGAPLLARRRRRGVGAGDAPRPAAAISTSRAAAGRTPASTSSPRTTASRSPTSSATTRSTTRPTARTTATARTTT